MALLVCAVYDTEANCRSEYTLRTLTNLFRTVDWGKHRLVLVDNGSCETTKKYLHDFSTIQNDGYNRMAKNTQVITNTENIGTAKAVNQGLKIRQPQEYCVKLDNDIEIATSGWVDEMEEAIERMPEIGVLGLKRKDLIQCQEHPDPNFRSYPLEVPHESGQRWIWVERTNDVMGTCTMLNWRLLDRIGYYYQGDWKYGMDDNLMNCRAHLAGFTTCFLPHIDITHVDTGSNPYTQEKHRLAQEVWARYTDIHNEFVKGTRDIYYDGD